MNPKITILLATYNRAHLVGKAIESARAQTFQDWEMVVADDGSTDNTESVIKDRQKKDPRIIYSKSEVNQGIAVNSNRGLKLARGEYVAILDDDDYWADSEKLKIQLEFLEKNKDYVGCGGGLIIIDNYSKELFRYLKPERDEEIRKKMLFSNPMANTTTLFRKSSAELVGYYDESTRYSADRDFWLKMGKIGKLYNFPLYFAYYLMSNQNTSIAKIRPHLKASLRFMKRYKNDYPSYRLALLINYLEYGYSFLPAFFRNPAHKFLARLRRLILG